MMEHYQKIMEFCPVKNLTTQNKRSLQAVVQELHEEIGEEEFEAHGDQFKTLFKKLNTTSKLAILRDKMHRAIIVELMSKMGIEFYNYSYFNRAKLTEKHLELLKDVGPYLFVEGVMIVSKMNVIYKNYSRIFIEDHLYQENQDIVDSQIREILKMCDDKKRNVNNNLKKLETLFKDQHHRVELVKELGKLLRDSWKKQKSKNKNCDMLPESEAQVRAKVNHCSDEKLEQYDEGLRENYWMNEEIQLKEAAKLIGIEMEEHQKCSISIGALDRDMNQFDNLISLKSYSFKSNPRSNNDLMDFLMDDEDHNMGPVY